MPAYDLVYDPHELQNLCTGNPMACAPFATAIAQWRAEMTSAQAAQKAGPVPTAAIDERTRERLKALGYDPRLHYPLQEAIDRLRFNYLLTDGVALEHALQARAGVELRGAGTSSRRPGGGAYGARRGGSGRTPRRR